MPKKSYISDKKKALVQLSREEIFDFISEPEKDAMSFTSVPRLMIITNQLNSKHIYLDVSVYEPSYEWFEGTSCIWDDNGIVLYNKDATCLDNYRNQAYFNGKYTSFDEVAEYIQGYFSNSDFLEYSVLDGKERADFMKKFREKTDLKFSAKQWENPDAVKEILEKQKKKEEQKSYKSNSVDLQNQTEEDLMKNGYRRIAFQKMFFKFPTPYGKDAIVLQPINAYDLTPDDGLSMVMSDALHPYVKRDSGKVVNYLFMSENEYNKLLDKVNWGDKNSKGYGVVLVKTKPDERQTKSSLYPISDLIDFSQPIMRSNIPFNKQLHDQNFQPKQDRVMNMLQSFDTKDVKDMSESELVQNSYSRLLWSDKGEYKGLHKIEFVRACDQMDSQDSAHRIYNPYVVNKKTQFGFMHIQYLGDKNYELLKNNSLMSGGKYDGVCYGKIEQKEPNEYTVSFGYNPDKPIVPARTPFDEVSHKAYLQQSNSLRAERRAKQASELNVSTNNSNKTLEVGD